MAAKFISVKQLAAAFGIHIQTMRKELRMIKGLKAKKKPKTFKFKGAKNSLFRIRKPFQRSGSMTRQEAILQRRRIAISRALLKNQAPYYTLNELKDIEKKMCCW